MAQFDRIAIDIADSFAESDKENKYLLIAMDYFTKWPDVYAIPNQEVSTLADALVTNVFCRFGVPMQLQSDQGPNFESGLMQIVLERLRVNKTRTTPLHPQSDGMVERNVVFGRELRLPCDVMFGATPDMEQLTTDYTAVLVERIHDIHYLPANI